MAGVSSDGEDRSFLFIFPPSPPLLVVDMD
jgi:hypothetical protein